MMTMSNTPTREHEGAAIWSPILGLKSGGTIKLPSSLTHGEAIKAAQIEATALETQGADVDWHGAQRQPI